MDLWNNLFLNLIILLEVFYGVSIKELNLDNNYFIDIEYDVLSNVEGMRKLIMNKCDF